jgi:uncharacterized protein
MKNAINWFEIPVKDFDRAKKFYENILGEEMPTMDAMGMKMAFFPADMNDGKVGGGIVLGEGLEPATAGTMVYLNGGDDLSVALGKVETAGGKVVLPKTSIGENGFMGHFHDTEGNKVGIHSMK